MKITCQFLILHAVAATAMAEPAGSVMLLLHTERERVTEYRYTSNATTTRLDRLGEPTRPPSPWNLIDRESGALTILRPHNQSISVLPADAFDPKDPAKAGTTLPAGLEHLEDLPPEVAALVRGHANPAAGITPPAPNRIGPDPALLPQDVELPEMPAGKSSPSKRHPPTRLSPPTPNSSSKSTINSVFLLNIHHSIFIMKPQIIAAMLLAGTIPALSQGGS